MPKLKPVSLLAMQLTVKTRRSEEECNIDEDLPRVSPSTSDQCQKLGIALRMSETRQGGQTRVASTCLGKRRMAEKELELDE
ncbi:hypothetical protein BaRGS_00017271 [Batillaria attramentaria]|uniref:Uncharacterized protein n=1 Tax=Batillaria attramentaria TaxID=370345 RepID=A0ABD0KXE9_9CAEN